MITPSHHGGPAWLVVALIYLAVPLLGIALFLRLRRSRSGHADAATISWQLFVLFVTYGGWVLVALTSAFWVWSGAASIGMAYLLLIAPFMMVAIALHARGARGSSRIHAAIFWSAAAYVPVVVLAVVGARLL